jgi:hypothetical protein
MTSKLASPIHRHPYDEWKSRGPYAYNDEVNVKPYIRRTYLGAPVPVRRHTRRGAWGKPVKNPPDVLYHVTPQSKLPSIMREGLLPSPNSHPAASSGRSNFPHLSNRIRGRVFLTDSDELIDTMRQFMGQHKRMVVVAAYVHGLKVHKGETFGEPIKENPVGELREFPEYYTTKRIKPERLTVLRPAESYA